MDLCHLPGSLMDGASVQLGHERVIDGLLLLIPAPMSHFFEPRTVVSLGEPLPPFLGESPFHPLNLGKQ